MSESHLPMWQRWAQFRYAVIGELLSCPPPKGQLQQRIGQLAQKSYQHLTDGQRQAAFRRQNREIHGFEVSHVHGLWHLDFHQAKIGILNTVGKWHRPVVLAILGDHYRLCCHLQLYLAETAQCLVHGLSQAFMKRGLPRAL